MLGIIIMIPLNISWYFKCLEKSICLEIAVCGKFKCIKLSILGAKGLRKIGFAKWWEIKQLKILRSSMKGLERTYTYNCCLRSQLPLRKTSLFLLWSFYHLVMICFGFSNMEESFKNSLFLNHWGHGRIPWASFFEKVSQVMANTQILAIKISSHLQSTGCVQ